MSIKKSMKKARQYLELSQVNFAAAIGCSRESVINWEAGKTEPAFKYIKSAARLCKIKPSKLIQWGE